MSLPDYVLSADEDTCLRRTFAPSNLGPWHSSASQVLGWTHLQKVELKKLGIARDPSEWVEGVNWMWVVVPEPQFRDFDVYKYRRAVRHVACPIVRQTGDSFRVIGPRGSFQTVFEGGQISRPQVRKARGWIGRG